MDVLCAHACGLVFNTLTTALCVVNILSHQFKAKKSSFMGLVDPFLVSLYYVLVPRLWVR